MKIAYVNSLIKQIETRKNKIVKARDELQALSENLEECVHDMNWGIGALQDGIENIKEAIEEISQNL